MRSTLWPRAAICSARRTKNGVERPCKNRNVRCVPLPANITPTHLTAVQFVRAQQQHATGMTFPQPLRLALGALARLTKGLARLSHSATASPELPSRKCRTGSESHRLLHFCMPHPKPQTMGRIAILTPRPLAAARARSRALTGMSPVRWEPWRRPAFDAVAGWGHAPTADRARRLARQPGVPYIAFEDGPLRSVRPGPAQPPMSMVMDRGGIYYDADSGSDLIALAARADWFVPEIAESRSAGSRDAAAAAGSRNTIPGLSGQPRNYGCRPDAAAHPGARPGARRCLDRRRAGRCRARSTRCSPRRWRTIRRRRSW